MCRVHLRQLLQFRPVDSDVDDRELVRHEEIKARISHFARCHTLHGLAIGQIVVPLHVDGGDDLLGAEGRSEPQEKRTQYPPVGVAK